MPQIPLVRTDDYEYELPQEKIASEPLSIRDHSKLLIGIHDEFMDAQYKDLAQFLTPGSLMVMNNTKVIPARIIFTKATSGVLEIFCLSPQQGTPDMALQDKAQSTWYCMIGGLKKWKTQHALEWFIEYKGPLKIQANYVQPHANGHEVVFSWDRNDICFFDILQLIGQMPIPPYLNRKSTIEDQTSYQTAYATIEGSVAAPTAGLHFTDQLIQSLTNNGIQIAHTTLHVGAGTFKPVKAEWAQDHVMHAEWIEADIDFIEKLVQGKTVICVGTTSLRTVESIYWYAHHCYVTGNLAEDTYTLKQWVPYQKIMPISTTFLLTNLIDLLKASKKKQLIFQTEIMILPTYVCRICNYLLTNFHQPKSTLLMLIHAFYGDRWKSLYEHALQHDYRFLSYGDGCLLNAQQQRSSFDKA